MEEHTLRTSQHSIYFIKITMSQLPGYKCPLCLKVHSLATNYSNVFLIYPIHYSKQNGCRLPAFKSNGDIINLSPRLMGGLLEVSVMQSVICGLQGSKG